MVVFGKKGSIRAKVVVLGQGGCIRPKWLYSSKSVVFVQSGCILAKVVVFGQNLSYLNKCGCIRAKWLFSGKSSFSCAKLFVLGQKWLY